MLENVDTRVASSLFKTHIQRSMNHVFLSTGSPAAAVATGVELVNRHLPRAPTGKLLRRAVLHGTYIHRVYRPELERYHSPHVGRSIPCFRRRNLLFPEQLHDQGLHGRAVTNEGQQAFRRFPSWLSNSIPTSWGIPGIGRRQPN